VSGIDPSDALMQEWPNRLRDSTCAYVPVPALYLLFGWLVGWLMLHRRSCFWTHGMFPHIF